MSAAQEENTEEQSVLQYLCGKTIGTNVWWIQGPNRGPVKFGGVSCMKARVNTEILF